MTENDRGIIEKIAGVSIRPTGGDSTSRSLIQDFIDGGLRNPKLANLELGPALTAAGFTPVTVAKTAGALKALDEAGFTTKEASEALELNEEVLQAVVLVTR